MLAFEVLLTSDICDTNEGYEHRCPQYKQGSSHFMMILETIIKSEKWPQGEANRNTVGLEMFTLSSIIIEVEEITLNERKLIIGGIHFPLP